MNSSFYSGLTGLSAYSNALNVIGNNLANLNTIGFKTSDISFEDMVARTFGGLATNAAGNPMQFGLGTLPSSVSGVFSQGSIQASAEPTNVALEGNGFFVVGDTVDSKYYTRAGDFSFDSEGNLINSSGKYVLGYTNKDANGNIIPSGALSILSFSANTISAPQATSYMEISSNLNSRDAVGATYSASTTIYDSKGAPHTVTLTFTHTGLSGVYDKWTYTASLPDADIAGAAANRGLLGTGALFFNSSGTYAGSGATAAAIPATTANIPFTTTAAFANGAAAQTFSWHLYETDGATVDTTKPYITGYPISSTTSSTSTDGCPPGNLTSIIFNKDGILQGVFSNGQVEELGQLAIAQFNNPKGLLRQGHSLFSETNASGTASIGAADTGGRGTVMGSSTEASNVDMASEFTKMLLYERGYQANSKIITAADTLTQTAINLVR
ncbi:MAG: flagellar hook protein FlgE [Candidatus Omnitrophota bacterium]